MAMNGVMSHDLLTALVVFAFVSSITPGPNNLMLMASGANFGFLRTLPHMLGVGLGFVFMVVLVGAGLVQVFDAYPVSYTVLRIVSVAYLLWLAWKIAHAAPMQASSGGNSCPSAAAWSARIVAVDPQGRMSMLTTSDRFKGAPPMAWWSMIATTALSSMPEGSWGI